MVNNPCDHLTFYNHHIKYFTVRQFNIYHPFGGILNHDCQRGAYEYQLVATVEAHTLKAAYMLGQNDFNDTYALLGVRSTSVGDIITDGDLCYFVTGTGFQEIPPTVLQYIDWSNHMETKEQIAQQMLDNPEDYGLLDATPKLTIQTIEQNVVDEDIYSPGEVISILTSNGYKNLGWLNSGIVPPQMDDYTEIYRNRSGSYTIVISPSAKLIYCIDMGD